MLIFSKRLSRKCASDALQLNMSMPVFGNVERNGIIDARSLDVRNYMDPQQLHQIFANQGEDNTDFDRWYRDWLINNPYAMSTLAMVLSALFQNKLVIVYVGSYEIQDMITESFIKYLVTDFGIKSLFIDNAMADIDEEIECIDMTQFDDFSEYGIEAAKRLIDLYKPNVGVTCNSFEIDQFGLMDVEHESLY